jgi:hypothetical protein
LNGCLAFESNLSKDVYSMCQAPFFLLSGIQSQKCR